VIFLAAHVWDTTPFVPQSPCPSVRPVLQPQERRPRFRAAAVAIDSLWRPAAPLASRPPAMAVLAAALLAWLSTGTRLARPQSDLELLEEQAIQAAAEHVAPAVVSIETVGGLERLGQVLLSSGPTTGLIVSPDGYIVSSAFGFASKPASILAILADGTRLPARLVATDHNRMLVLLKVETDQPLATVQPVPEEEMQVGQWAIALGRTYEGGQPNVSVGIVSATQRIWGKAVQTDAKVSPANYGGPLVDIRGHVLGVLVPLSPMHSGQMAGVEWYDSGIGFAVPLVQVLQVLPRLQQGQDLYPGVMGISLSTERLHSSPAVIAACVPNSPAYKAGLRPGDRIIEVDGRPIERQVQLLNEVHRRYAGDVLSLAVQRGEQRLEFQVELVREIPPYQRPFLGILPRREADGASSGVTVRYVYPDSPAAAADMQPADRLVLLEGKPLTNAEDLALRLSSFEVGSRLRLAVERGNEVRQLELVLAAEPEHIPPELPPARDALPLPPERPARGPLPLKIPEFQQECLLYVPESYDPRFRYGLVVWLHGPGGFQEEALLARWQRACADHDLILVAPRAVDPNRWGRAELEFIRKVLDEVRSRYSIDPLRVAAHGYQTGGAMGYVLAFNLRDRIRGVAAVDAPLPLPPPENDPLQRLTVLLTTARASTYARQIDAAISALRARKYSVTVLDQGDQARYLSDDEFSQLLRWLDSLDRI